MQDLTLKQPEMRVTNHIKLKISNMVGKLVHESVRARLTCATVTTLTGITVFIIFRFSSLNHSRTLQPSTPPDTPPDPLTTQTLHSIQPPHGHSTPIHPQHRLHPHQPTTQTLHALHPNLPPFHFHTESNTSLLGRPAKPSIT